MKKKSSSPATVSGQLLNSKEKKRISPEEDLLEELIIKKSRLSSENQEQDPSLQDLNQKLNPDLLTGNEPRVCKIPERSGDEVLFISSEFKQTYIKSALFVKSDFNEKEVVTQLPARTKFYYYNNKTEQSRFFHRSKKAQNFVEASNQDKIALAVVGGNILRLVMGKFLPKYKVAEQIPCQQDERFYRLSSKVDNFSQIDLNKTPEDKNIRGLFFSLLLSYFVGDTDFSNNIGFVIKGNDSIVIKIDPESSFCDDCFFEDYEEVKKHIFFLMYFTAKVSVDEIDDLDYESEEEFLELLFGDIPGYFADVFSYPQLNESKRFYELLPVRQEELFYGLSCILNTSLPAYMNLVDEVPMDPRKQLKLKNALANRIDLFAKVANELPGFKVYYEERRYLHSDLVEIYGRLESGVVPDVQATQFKF
nr:hypothetical protein [Legionella jordanis]